MIKIIYITLLWLAIIVGLVVAQWMMQVPSSNGDIELFCRHTLGIWLAFFTGAFWAENRL